MQRKLNTINIENNRTTFIYNIKKLRELTLNSEKENKRFFSKLKQKKLPGLDASIHALHNDVFDELDCLDCANCCRNISPIITDRDIERMAGHEKMKQAAFIKKYLVKDEEDDWVFPSTPCPFIEQDNYCRIYGSRPKACREYPHTDRRKMKQILSLTKKNMQVCPAVYEIIRRLKKEGL